MTIAFLDDGGVLGNRYVTRAFTATLPLAYACVDYFDPKRPNEKRAQEVVWRDGAFQYPYDRQSTKVGNLYTVVRENGWADSLHLRAEEAGSAVKTPALQPLDASTVAAWTLLSDQRSPGVDVTDRSGNHRQLLSPGDSCLPSLIPHYSFYAIVLQAGYGAIIGGGGVHDPSVSGGLLGEFSFNCVLWQPGFNNPSHDEWVYAHGDYSAGSGGETTAGIISGSRSGGNNIVYYHRSSVGDEILVSGFARPSDSAFHYLGVSRASDGVTVTITLDGATWTGACAHPPTGGANGMHSLQGHVGDTHILQGGNYDAMVFSRALTPAEHQVRRAIMMGL